MMIYPDQKINELVAENAALRKRIKEITPELPEGWVFINNEDESGKELRDKVGYRQAWIRPDNSIYIWPQTSPAAIRGTATWYEQQLKGV